MFGLIDCFGLCSSLPSYKWAPASVSKNVLIGRRGASGRYTPGKARICYKKFDTIDVSFWYSNSVRKTTSYIVLCCYRTPNPFQTSTARYRRYFTDLLYIRVGCGEAINPWLLATVFLRHGSLVQ